MNAALAIQNPENKNMVPWNPNDAVKSGKYFITINEVVHSIPMQNDTPKSFNFSGITSEMTKNGSVKTAQEAIKITNEKPTIGIQFTDSSATPDDFSIIYTPKVIKPKAIPTVDTMNKN